MENKVKYTRKFEGKTEVLIPKGIDEKVKARLKAERNHEAKNLKGYLRGNTFFRNGFHKNGDIRWYQVEAKLEKVEDGKQSDN